MKRITVEGQVIKNIYSYLKHTDADEVVIRTSQVRGGWHDIEFDANAAGFNITRFINPEYEARHQFPECYKFWRR